MFPTNHQRPENRPARLPPPTGLQFPRLSPAVARYIRVRLISKRGSGFNNDGYFDALSLTTEWYMVIYPSF